MYMDKKGKKSNRLVSMWIVEDMDVMHEEGQRLIRHSGGSAIPYGNGWLATDHK